MRKWLNWVALVILFSIACGFLSNWQFSRRETKLAAIALVQRNYELPAATAESLVAHGHANLDRDIWRSITLTGRYQPTATLLVRNRPNNGNGGFEELVPFASQELGIVYVSRGWIASGDKQDYPDSVPLPTTEQITLTGKILAAEPILDRTAPKGEISTINVRLADKLTGLHSGLHNAYLREADEVPGVGPKLTAMPSPSLDEGNNLSYAVQWIIFAIMAVAALIWRIRRDRQLELGIEPKRKITRADRDNAAEDAVTTAK